MEYKSHTPKYPEVDRLSQSRQYHHRSHHSKWLPCKTPDQSAEESSILTRTTEQEEQKRRQRHHEAQEEAQTQKLKQVS
uniref:Uncharacterized protein n=1 Tax=Kalanchoe fedtschenkoi TaxID=63787 RepID=A0A7N0TGE2_KALFE